VDTGIQYRANGSLANTSYYGERESKGILLEGRADVLSTVFQAGYAFASEENASIFL
jgi:hypothetical protein